MNFQLRQWQSTDLTSLVKHANNFNIAKNLTDKFPFPYTEKDGIAFIHFATEDNGSKIFAIAVNDEAVGGIGIHPQPDVYQKNMELGYWLAEPFWGQGIITQAIKQTVDFAFANFEIDRVFARPYGPNTASQRVLEKAGFVLEGRLEKTFFKNNEYLDELIYAVRRINTT
jgi:[ribosomal protein S5]-alanine N-acetyltransferase